MTTPTGNDDGWLKYAKAGSLLDVVAFGLGVFHLAVVSGLISLSTLPMRIIHVALAFSLLFALRPMAQRVKGTTFDRLFSAALIVAILIASWWLMGRWKAIAFSGGMTEPGDFWAGLVILIVVFEAARRGVGTILAIIVLVFFSYAFVSPYLPGVLNGRGYGLERIVIFLTTDTAGVYGIPVGVAATYIIVFSIFGALLTQFGASDFFFDVSRRLTRGLRAASAKSAVLFSTLIGMVSGSAAGNVAVTGVVTIPMMKREGYAPHQAGAVEAVASTGGQLMPPVMGAAAFIMAEIVGVSYTQVMATAILPALLFFGSAFFIVHLQAVKSGLQPFSEANDDPRSGLRLLWEGLPFIAAFVMLIALMLAGYSPVKASLWAIAALLCGDLLVNRRIGLTFAQRIVRGICEGVKGIVTISAACAAAGIIAGILGITGLGSKIAVLIESASGGYLLLALIFTMVTSIILGMGLPTTAAYLILATVVAPALMRLGVPGLTAHFFVFYYGCISTITPPVALAAYVAGGIAGADINKVGWTAASYALASFVMPFAIVFSPALTLNGSVVENIIAGISGFAAIGAVAAGVIGCITGPLSAPMRVFAFIAAGCLLFGNWIGMAVGAALLFGIIFLDRNAVNETKRV